MFRSSFFALLIAFSGTAIAQDLNYTFLQGTYEFIDVDPVNINGDGIGINGSFAMSDRVYLIANYQGAGLDLNVDLTRWSAGAGIHAEMTSNVDMFAEMSYLYLDLDGPASLSDNDGLFGRAGVRTAITEALEIQGAARYDDLSEEFGFDVGVLYNLTDLFAVGAFGIFDDEVTTYSAGVRLNF